MLLGRSNLDAGYVDQSARGRGRKGLELPVILINPAKQRVPRAFMNQINWRGGKEIFGSNLDLIKDIPFSEQDFYQDMAAYRYDHCVIDIGSHYRAGYLEICVIELVEGKQEWNNPYCRIKCYEPADFYSQLQRAIDIYPEELRRRNA